MKQLMDAGKLLDVAQYRKGIQRDSGVNKWLGNDKIIGITGVTTTLQDDGSNIITAIFTNFGKFVPVKPSVYNPQDGVKQLDFKYYSEVEDVIRTEPNANSEQQYNQRMRNVKTEIFNLKKLLGAALQNLPETKATIQSINTDTQTTRYQKIEQLTNILSGLLIPSALQGNTTFLLKVIANEILQDNLENLLLNNLVTSDVFNPDEISKRDTESVLLSIDDIQRWIRKFNVE